MATRQHARPERELLDIVLQYPGLEHRANAEAALRELRALDWVVNRDSEDLRPTVQALDLRERIGDLLQDPSPERTRRHMRYLFLRHAETEVSDRSEWHGTSDPPLSLKGREHTLTATEQLRQLGLKITAVICSDFSRAVETATVFGEAFNCAVVRNPLLRERYLGEWEGLTQAEIERKWPGLIEAWRSGSIDGPPGGETDDQVTRRVRRALCRTGTGIVKRRRLSSPTRDCSAACSLRVACLTRRSRRWAAVG
jgi:Histidine phosphatase superfamily (branch 1)